MVTAPRDRDRAFVDALREVLGMRPLYFDDAKAPVAKRFAARLYTPPLSRSRGAGRWRVVV